MRRQLIDNLQQDPRCAIANLHDLVEHWGNKTPDAVAIVSGEVRLSFSAFKQWVDAIASALVGAGVNKGDRVATYAHPSGESWAAFLAAASIGAIWVGLNPKYKAEELAHVLSDADPALVLHPGTDEAQAALAGAMQVAGKDVPRVSFADALIGQPHPLLVERRANVGGYDACMIVYTSGSTGTPKGAVLHHHGIMSFAERQNRAWPLSRVDVLNYFPINHVGCICDVSAPALAAGGKIVFLDRFDPVTALRLLEKERLTLWGSVPSVFQMQLALPEITQVDLSSVELIVWEGAAMDAGTIARLVEICPRLATNYGMTESTSAITIVAPTDEIEVLANSVGHPFEGVEVRLANAEGIVTRPGEIGEIQARSDLNMLGYWRRPDDTAVALGEDGWLRTGDLAELRPDGRYRIVGRAKEMYKSGGYNVYPAEVEAGLLEHPEITAAAVVAVPDALWGEVGIAFVTGAASLDPAAVLAFARERFANYKLPKRLVIRDDLPLLPIGKVDRRALAREAAALNASA